MSSDDESSDDKHGHSQDWPQLDPKALHGITGEIVRLATAHSEVDPVAIAATNLAWAGATFGRTMHILVGDREHHTRLFIALVGDSSRARKGTSEAPVRQLWLAAEDALQEWKHGGLLFPCGLPLNVSPGPMSTGEGIIAAIRDSTTEPGDGSDEQDNGVPDKRLLIVEGEFGAPLRAAQRTGNILSAILRSAWDGTTLAPIIKNNPVRASDPHVCFVAHITNNELQALLETCDIWNGFANRIIWLAVRRQGFVPLPRPLDVADVSRIGNELARLVVFAHTARGGSPVVVLTDRARQIWVECYPELSRDYPGILGVLTARAEAQVLRLSLVYALLDGVATIDEAHLEAARALWSYASASVRMIFGDREADPHANKLLSALKIKSPMSQTEVGRVFNGHMKRDQLTALLERLEKARKIEKIYVKTGGRDEISWSLPGRGGE